MRRWNAIQVYARAARSCRGGGEGDGGGGGDDPTQIDVNSPAFKAALETATAGLKTNRDAVLEEKRQLKAQYDELTAKVSALGDLDTVAAMVKRFESDAEAKLLAEGKIDEVLSNRTEAMRADAQAKVDAANAARDETDGRLAKALGRINELLIGAEVDQACADLDCAPTARRDVRRAALEVFGVNEKTEGIEARDAEGVLRIGPDGKNPLTPRAWLESQKEHNPHWWGASRGGGAGGGKPGGGKPPSAKKLDGMSGRQLLTAALEGR